MFITGYIVPKYYYVPQRLVREEKQCPGSQNRVSSGENEEDSNYFLWGQSVYIVMRVLSKWGGCLLLNTLSVCGKPMVYC